MSIDHGPISPLRKRMIEGMCLRKLSEKTQSGYLRWVKHFSGFLGRSPDTATAEEELAQGGRAPKHAGLRTSLGRR